MNDRTGVMLINLGTPELPTSGAVRRYLRQFLSDERVIDLSAPARWLLLNLFILPFRPKKSAGAYRKIWTDRGSPLLTNPQDLCAKMSAAWRDKARVRFAMRYGTPPITAVLEAFRAEGYERLIAVPLYPQYASSSTGSCLAELYRAAAGLWNVPALSVLPPFYGDPAFTASLATVAREALGDLARYDHFLFSFHGLPERQVVKCDLGEGAWCLARPDCCEQIASPNRYCYRAQSVAAARALANALHIPAERYDIAFQSRLGRTPWIRPYTDELLAELPKQGVKRLAVLVPSFTADCLETLEEIAIRGKESFIAAGGESLDLVPSQNAHPAFVSYLTNRLTHLLQNDPLPT